MVSLLNMTSLPDQVDAARADKLAYYLSKAVSKANREHRMLADGDRILVAVSGGKDSLTLLDLLHRRQHVAQEHYYLVAGLVRTDYFCGSTVSEEWLRQWCASRSIPLVVDEVRIAAELANTSASRCFRCAWNRRKALFQMADRLACNKLAFGHNADDIAETTLMNLFYNARFRRMEPRVSFFGGRIIVIRPLAYVEERDVVPFVRASGYPLRGEPCPEGMTSRRAVVKRMLREIENDCHQVKRHIYRAVEHYQASLRRTRNDGSSSRRDSRRRESHPGDDSALEVTSS